MLGDVRPQVWISDCYGAQLKSPALHHQVCHTHERRHLKFAIDAERSSWAYRVKRLLDRSRRLKKRQVELPRDLYAHQVGDVLRRWKRLIQQPVSGEVSRRIQKRYRKHWDKMFTFLHHHHVPPDNNGCERALRTSVVHRKVSGGFRTRWGPTPTPR